MSLMIDIFFGCFICCYHRDDTSRRQFDPPTASLAIGSIIRLMNDAAGNADL